MRKTTILVLALSAMLAITGHVGRAAAVEQEPVVSLSDCEWCGAGEAPANASWECQIAGPDEEGEALVITGTIFHADGVKPASNVVLYVYHTNAQGIYPRRGDETGNARRHGYLRGWLRTGEDGRYRISTIKPASYPTGSEPAHIHAVVLEPGRPEYWIDSFLFEGDPLLTDRRRARLDGIGGDGVVALTRDAAGIWRGERDIMLKPAP